MDLHEFCNKYLLDEKIFIVPSKSIGMQLINRMALEGSPAINLKTFTLTGLAFYICEEYINKEISLIVDNVIGSNLIINILKDFSRDNNNFFFKEDLIDSSTAKEVYSAIMELKLGGVEKFPDIKNLDIIYEEYEKRLDRLKAADHCDIIIKASEIVDRLDKIVIGILSNLEVNRVEEEFLNKLSNVIKIKTPVTKINENRKKYYFKDDLIDYSLKDKEVCFFSAYGSKEEIGYIIEDIKKRRLPLDNVVIAYTNSKYADLLNIEFEKENIPITFGSGLGIENSSVYRFIDTIFNWAGKYYNLNEIRPIFANGDIKSPFSSPRLYEELIKKKIIFGKQNYIKKLELYKENEDSNKSFIKEFFEDLFLAIPEKKVSLNAYIPRLKKLIDKYVKNINKYDGAAKLVVLETLSSLEDLDMEVGKAEYFDIVLSYVKNSKILRTQPQPGHVFANNYKNTSYTGRKHLYLIGMDSNSLSNKIVESPILLDLMKNKLSNHLNFANESYNFKKNKIKELLSVDFESISIGYSNFDTVEVKPVTPSQIYSELKEETINVDYNNLLRNWTIYGRDLVKSGTGLEVLAECARKAYLQYKVGLKEKEDVEISIDRWLDPLEKGIIVHDLLKSYFDLDKEEQNEENLLNMVENACARVKEEKDSVLEHIFVREKEEIFKVCKNMIIISTRDNDWEIYANELSFGLDDTAKLSINICDLDLEISGAIDRVDRGKQNRNHFRIVDYKTGSMKNFDRKLRITIGRGKNKTFDYSETTKLQYYIYKKALEEILKSEFDNPVIERFTYVFDGDCIDLEFDDDFIDTIENRILSLLNMDILEEDSKIFYEDIKCRYCIYKNICIVDKALEEVEIGE